MLFADDRRALQAIVDAHPEGFEASAIEARKARDGSTYFALYRRKTTQLHDLDVVFATSAAVARIAKAHGADYVGWDVE